ncbi:MAG: hypothetical protein ACRCXZ_01480 [Patescibacteria group bacterium]
MTTRNYEVIRTSPIDEIALVQSQLDALTAKFPGERCLTCIIQDITPVNFVKITAQEYWQFVAPDSSYRQQLVDYMTSNGLYSYCQIYSMGMTQFIFAVYCSTSREQLASFATNEKTQKVAGLNSDQNGMWATAIRI